MRVSKQNWSIIYNFVNKVQYIYRFLSAAPGKYGDSVGKIVIRLYCDSAILIKYQIF